jgi:hypothetical protein
MHKICSVAFAATLALGVAGCATVVNGTNVDYMAETDPEGAQVKYLNGLSCTSPCEVELRRKDDMRVDISLDGYKPTYVLLQSKLGSSTFGNILLGGGVGAIVDGSNGASNRLHPGSLKVRLAPVDSDEEAVLLDKDGEIMMTVEEHNNSVRIDVAKSIGPELAGLNPEEFAAALAEESAASEEQAAEEQAVEESAGE